LHDDAVERSILEARAALGPNDRGGAVMMLTTPPSADDP